MTDAELIFDLVVGLLADTGALLKASRTETCLTETRRVKFMISLAYTGVTFGNPRKPLDMGWESDDEFLSGGEQWLSAFDTLENISVYEKKNPELRETCRTVSSCRAGSYDEFVIRLVAAGVDVDAASKRGRELR